MVILSNNSFAQAPLTGDALAHFDNQFKETGSAYSGQSIHLKDALRATPLSPAELAVWTKGRGIIAGKLNVYPIAKITDEEKNYTLFFALEVAGNTDDNASVNAFLSCCFAENDKSSNTLTLKHGIDVLKFDSATPRHKVASFIEPLSVGKQFCFPATDPSICFSIVIHNNGVAYSAGYMYNYEQKALKAGTTSAYFVFGE